MKRPRTPDRSFPLAVTAFCLVIAAVLTGSLPMGTDLRSQLTEDGLSDVPPPALSVEPWDAEEGSGEEPADPLGLLFPELYADPDVPADEPTAIDLPPAVPVADEVTTRDLFDTIVAQKRQLEDMEETLASMRATIDTLNATVQELRAAQLAEQDAALRQAAGEPEALPLTPVAMEEEGCSGFWGCIWDFFGGNIGKTVKNPELR